MNTATKTGGNLVEMKDEIRTWIIEESPYGLLTSLGNRNSRALSSGRVCAGPRRAIKEEGSVLCFEQFSQSHLTSFPQ